MLASLTKWFQDNGDHFLNQLSIILLGGNMTGVVPPTWKYAPFVTVILSMLHTFFVPPSTPTAVPTVQAAKQAGNVRLFMLAALTLLAACAALGIAAPQSFDEKLAAAQVSETAVVNAATTAVSAGTLSSTAGQHVLDTAHQVDGFIKAAQAAESAGTATGSSAANNLALATSALSALNTFLQAETTAKGK